MLQVGRRRSLKSERLIRMAMEKRYASGSVLMLSLLVENEVNNVILWTFLRLLL